MGIQVSIIVPVYNTERHLCTCLDSIISQTFSDFEVILVDDGSTDSSGKICDEYAAKDSRFVVVHKQNEGVAKARITAFEHSRGKLITFIDADDYVSSEYIEKLVQPIVQNGFDMVTCDYYEIDDGFIKEPTAKLTGEFSNQEIIDFISHHYFYDTKCKGFGMTHYLWTKMVKREFVKDGLDKGIGLWIGEDQVSLFEMLSKVSSLCMLPDRLYFYVQHPGQTVKKYDYSIWSSIILMFEKYREILGIRNIDTNGLRIRTWINLNYTISNKMLPSGINMKTFSKHMSRVRNTSYMQDFFGPMSISFGVKDNIKYWLLKLKLYHVFYLISKK